MMKLGEGAKRLSHLEVLAPVGIEWALAEANIKCIIHQYHQIDRELTWLTLSVDLPGWRSPLAPMVETARTALETDDS